MDVKAWLGTTGLTIEQDISMDEQTFPFVWFTDEVDAGYRDLSTKMLTHNLTVELYTENIDSTSEGLLETLLGALNNRYTKKRQWVTNCFVTTYTANFDEEEGD